MIALIAMIVAGIVAVPIFIFALECLCGLRPLPPLRLAPNDQPPAFAILVPAHDEADGIAETVGAILGQLRPGDRLLVVADNCTDDTAAWARRAGANVVERHDRDAIGKGHALAFGRDALTRDPPDVVIIIDADCRVSAGGLERLALEAGRGNRAVQAAYLMEPPADSNALVAISSFAFRVRNVVRQRGLTRLGGAPLLQGTGMAFPWPMFEAAPLATDDIVEDLNLGIALLGKGHRIGWSEAMSVTSQPASREATIAQRTRWEHGSTAAALRNIPTLLSGAIRQRRFDMALLAFDLMVPPLALLLTIAIIAWSAAFFLALAGAGAGPLALLSFALLMLALAVLAAWAAEGRGLLPLRTLLKVPFYLLWKLPIYLRLLTGREKSWVRTARK